MRTMLCYSVTPEELGVISQSMNAGASLMQASMDISWGSLLSLHLKACVHAFMSSQRR